MKADSGARFSRKHQALGRHVIRLWIVLSALRRSWAKVKPSDPFFHFTVTVATSRSTVTGSGLVWVAGRFAFTVRTARRPRP